jgi:protein-S-isoprenylcysteine O-methyltransferase Ste14
VKSREIRRREAWHVIWLTLGVIVALLLFLGATDSLLKWLNENSAAVGAIVTTVYACITILLWRATKVQAKITGMALQQQREEKDQRWRALATGLLSEVRFLEGVLRDVYRVRAPGTPAEEMIQPF